MFGYIRIFKQELDEADFQRFNAYYCGLCKEIGKHSSLARLGLSYDMAFLSVLIAAVLAEDDEISECRCMLHPLKKRHKISSSRAISYAADMSILLAYRKLEDDFKDEHSPKAFVGMIINKSAFKKVQKKYIEKDKKLNYELAHLSRLESEHCTEPDMLADCFAKMCEVIFTPDFITDSETQKILSWLGYNIGRWIYLIDAFDDFEKDIKNKNYNPFISFGNDIKDITNIFEPSLTHTLANIAAAYDLLEIHRNDNILKNILYAGLSTMQNKILKTSEEINGSI